MPLLTPFEQQVMERLDRIIALLEQLAQEFERELED